MEEKNEKVTLEGVIAEAPIQVKYKDYSMRWPALKRILQLILNVKKVSFSGEACDVPEQIPIGYVGIPPIFKGNKIRITKIFSEKDILAKYYRLKNEGMLLIPEQIELLDDYGEIKATYIQDRINDEGGFARIKDY